MIIDHLPPEQDGAYCVFISIPIKYKDGKMDRIEYKFHPNDAIRMGIGLIVEGIKMTLIRFWKNL